MGEFSYLILIALVAVGIGFALGSLVTGSRSDRVPAEKPKTSPISNLVQIAGVMTDRGGKAVYLQVEGKIIRSINDLSREQRTRLSPYFEVLSSWFLPPTSKTSAAAASMMVPAGGQVNETVQTETGDTDQSPVQRPSMNPINILARAIQSDVNLPQQTKSIAAQIDEILQDKIEGSELEQRGVRLVELPSKGMVVMVGLDQYAGVDEVPDEEIRMVIKSAVKDWEQQVSQ
jgi:hypothetical protein